MAVVKRLNSDYDLIALDSNVGITATTVTINGNLVVLGSQTSLVTTNTIVYDNLITLSSGAGGGPNLDAGIEVDRGNLPKVGIRWHEPALEWQSTTDGTNWTRLGSDAVSQSTLQTVTNLGSTTNNAVRFENTTASTDTNEGSVVIVGGLGVGERIVTQNLTVKDHGDFEGNINALSKVNVSGTMILNGQLSNTAPLTINPGSLIYSPVLGNIEFDGNFLYVTTNSGRQKIQIGAGKVNTFLVRAVATTNVSVSSPSAFVWDDVVPNNGDRVLLTAQSNSAENGIYVWSAAGSPMTRAEDFNTLSGASNGWMIIVAEGTLNHGSVWQIETVDPITVGTTGIDIRQVVSRDSIALGRLVKDNTSGFLARTNYGTVALRTINTTSPFLSVSNGDGKNGNITISSGIIPVTSGGTGRGSVFGYLFGTGSSFLTSNTVPFGNVVNTAGSNLNVVLDSLTASTNANLAAEVARATSAETTLQTNITNLGTAANSSIAAETARATSAETTLQTNINNLSTSANALVAAETARAIAAETSLQGNITSLGTAANAAIAAETARATSAETTLQTNITNLGTAANAAVAAETARAIAAETSLQSNIAAETAARIAGNVYTQQRIDYVVSNLDPAAIDSLTEIVSTFGNTALMGTQQSSNVNITGGNIAVANITANTGTYGNLTTTNLNVTNFNVTGNVSFSNLFGNVIPLGANSVGTLNSNAVSVSTTYDITDTIALMNEVLGKLVPQRPPNFPGAQTLTISSLSTYRMTNFSQTDNTTTGGKNVSGGATVTSIRRANTYTTNTIANVGPGDTGTVTIYKNGVASGSKAMVAGQNGTFGDLIISNNQDYHNIVPAVNSNFWYSFNASATGTVSAGWNEIVITDSSTGSTNTPNWYYDSATPGTPTFTATSLVNTSNVVSYSSTVPHYTNLSQFAIGFNINALSGDTYPTTDTFATGTAGGALTAPVSVNYAQAGITTPLARNLYVSSGSASVSTTSNIISGFGLSSWLVGPSVSVNNSYNVGTQVFAQGANILYKTGTSTQIEETSIPVNSVGSGAGNAYRITLTGNVDTPAYTGVESAFNSQTGTLQVYDATVVGATLKHDVTDYSTGYLPVGPNLNTGRAGAQYFTFKFVRSVVSKFDIKYTGTIAGLWVSLPGSTIDTTSTLNGWLTMGTAYSGAGIPGAGAGGNGSNGCAVGGTAVFNSAQTNKSVTATFGTVSSSNTATNAIYVRVRLTGGQSLTAISIETATH